MRKRNYKFFAGAIYFAVIWSLVVLPVAQAQNGCE